jgi:hypothetical protein
LAGIDGVYFGLITIEKNHFQPAIGKDDAERESHMAATPDDDYLFQFPHELLITHS